jgi:predicted nicotinamide N-methyase
VALARHLSILDLAGLRVVELGCGVGLPSAVALERGARVLATDHYDAALEFARHNARTNTGREPETAHLDWHSPVEESVRRSGLGERFDLVIAADVLYEPRHAPALARLIPALLESNGEVQISDPRRKDTPIFLEQMESRGFRHSQRSAVVRQGERDVEVRIHRLWLAPV